LQDNEKEEVLEEMREGEVCLKMWSSWSIIKKRKNLIWES